MYVNYNELHWIWIVKTVELWSCQIKRLIKFYRSDIMVIIVYVFGLFWVTLNLDYEEWKSIT